MKFGCVKNQGQALRSLRGNFQRLIVACVVLRNIAHQEKETIQEESRDSDSNEVTVTMTMRRTALVVITLK